MEVINTILITFISVTAFGILMAVLALKYALEQNKKEDRY